MDIHSFWDSIIHQDAGSLKQYFHKEAIIRWHCTNEEFSLEEYIKVNCEYPGYWKGEIERIEKLENKIILVGKVSPMNHESSDHVVSFLTLKEDKILEMDEYWASDSPAPLWRQKMKMGKAIR